jgi:MFS family permease
MAKSDDAPIDPTLKEAELRDDAARAYCDRLAQQIRVHHGALETHEAKSAFAQSWRMAFKRTVPELDTVAEPQIAALLHSEPRAQARLATLIEYPPGKWLLEQELAAKGHWPPSDPKQDAYAVADSLGLSGICFSGGGIRSATFNLGILQGLAVSNRINSFDYLSSVSGGGYIHQFFASWISCENIEKVKRQLQPLPGPPSQRSFWPEPLRWLRRYSNYLTPRVGLFTADTWVAFAVWLRNTFLNQIVLISSILLVLLLPHFYLSSRGRLAHFLLDHGMFTAAIVFAGFLFASSIIFFTQIIHPPADHCHPVEESGFGQTGVLGLVFVPVLISVFAVCPYLYRSSFWAGNPLPQTVPHSAAELRHANRVHRVVDTIDWPKNTGIVPRSTRIHISHLHRLAERVEGPAASTVLAGAGTPAPASAKPYIPPPGEPDAMDNLRAWQMAYSFHWWKPLTGFDEDTSTSWVFTSMLAGIALLVLSGVRSIPQNWRRIIVLLGMVGAIGCGYVLLNLSRLAIFIASFFLPLEHVTRTAIPLLPWLGLTVVFVSIEIAGGLIGNMVDVSVREWFARLRAWSFLFGLVWFAFTASSLLGAGLVSWFFHVAHIGKPLWIGWIGTTLVSVLAGKSSFISGTPKDERSKSQMLLNGLVLIGPPVFIAGLVLTASWVIEKALGSIQSQIGDQMMPHSDFLSLLVLLAITALLFGWRIDVNEFSLHSFYRDRIARCYGGASNPDRRANRFTGFAASDKRLRLIDLLPSRFSDARLKKLWANTCGPDFCSTEPQPPTYEGPFPIFCTTLNLSFGQDLAYQERKGTSFAFTPLYCGYDVGWTETDTDRVQFNGYAPTRSFAYEDGGPRMATAVATSGAAMSPNWGFHSSPTMAFLLTIFNVRLGLWIRNPRHKRFRLRGRHSNPSSPWFGLFYLLAELFGLVNDEAAFVYLTDGGHFENMGLYELVRRHCTTIVICDAEQDGDLSFQGIGMAIRKCRIDHGAEITLDLTQLEPTGTPPASSYPCIPGIIRYANGTVGQILYIKAAYTRDLPADLVNFHKENPTFPNTSTMDQWFSESQFESYRRLGQHYASSDRVRTWLDRHLPVRPS